jgi:hypothetical protein
LVTPMAFTPPRAKRADAVSPAGPAPTTSTSVSISFIDCDPGFSVGPTPRDEHCILGRFAEGLLMRMRTFGIRWPAGTPARLLAGATAQALAGSRRQQPSHLARSFLFAAVTPRQV